MKSHVNAKCKQIMLTTGKSVNNSGNNNDGDNVSVNFKLMFGSDKGDYVLIGNERAGRIDRHRAKVETRQGQNGVEGIGISRGKVGFNVLYLSDTIFLQKGFIND